MAIKVNGTTVINDSRALTNIASVDAATVTALGNAGVGGGATSLITDWTSIPASTTWTVSFPSGYDVISIFWQNMAISSSSSATDLVFRLGSETGNKYYYGRSNAASTSQNNRVPFGGGGGTGYSYPSYHQGKLNIYWPRDGSRQTQFEIHNETFIDYGGGSYGPGYYNDQNGFVQGNASHTSMYFYEYSGNSYASGGAYAVYGVNL